MTALFGIIVMGFIYFFPTINAYHAKQKNTDAIFAVNLFFGWTLIGWVVALIWSLKK